MSMNKKCVQCGKLFTLSDSELEFFKSKKLSVPKRCKECREQNRANKPRQYKSYYLDNANKSDLTLSVVTAAITIALLFLKVQYVWIFTGIAAIKHIATIMIMATRLNITPTLTSDALR